MTWLQSLPHQIPFRAASDATHVDDKTIEGVFLCTANDALARGPIALEVMLVEAMAQIGGGLAFHETRGHGLLTGIDRCRVDRTVAPGDVVRIVVRLEAEFGGIFRFEGTGSIDGLDVVKARFYLAAPSS